MHLFGGIGGPDGAVRDPAGRKLAPGAAGGWPVPALESSWAERRLGDRAGLRDGGAGPGSAQRPVAPPEALAFSAAPAAESGTVVVAGVQRELVFRGLLLPSALDGVQPLALLPWMALSVGLFVLWHHLARWSGLISTRRSDLEDPRVLVQTALLGVACGLAHVVSGSLWWAVLLHWLAVVAGRECLGDGRQLESSAECQGESAGGAIAAGMVPWGGQRGPVRMVTTPVTGALSRASRPIAVQDAHPFLRLDGPEPPLLA